MIALTQVRGSRVSMGAEGGSHAVSTENGCTLQNFSDFIDTYSARGFKRVVGAKANGCGLKLGDFTCARHTC